MIGKKKLKRLNLIIACIIYIGATAFALADDWRWVSNQYPTLFKIVSKHVGPVQAKDFFNGWTETGKKMFESARQKLINSEKKHKSNIHNESYHRYAGPIYSFIGELLLAKHIRSFYSNEQDILIMNAYDWQTISEYSVVSP